MRRIKWISKQEEEESSSSSDDDVTLASLEQSPCKLVWEGQISKPAFKSFTFEAMKNESLAKKFLQTRHIEQYWEICKSSAHQELSTNPLEAALSLIVPDKKEIKINQEIEQEKPDSEMKEGEVKVEAMEQ